MKIYKAIYDSEEYEAPQIQSIDILRKNDTYFWVNDGYGQVWSFDDNGEQTGQKEPRMKEKIEVITPRHHNTFEEAKQWILKVIEHDIWQSKDNLKRFQSYYGTVNDFHDE